MKSDTIRFKILQSLREARRTRKELADVLGLSYWCISDHIYKLTQEGRIEPAEKVKHPGYGAPYRRYKIAEDLEQSA